MQLQLQIENARVAIVPAIVNKYIPGCILEISAKQPFATCIQSENNLTEIFDIVNDIWKDSFIKCEFGKMMVRVLMEVKRKKDSNSNPNRLY